MEWNEYSVSGIALAIKTVMEDGFKNVKIRGEVSGAKFYNGHIYFTLKDENACLNGVCWRGVAAKLGFAIEDGLEVICYGSLTTYPGRSSYQIIAENVEIAGVGAILKMLEARKKALAAEGLFDKSRKKPIPFLPKTIGIITSLKGAVIRDILHRVRERFPVYVVVWGVAVQGQGSAEQIISAIRGFHNLGGKVAKPDVLIIARGGGSVEDLMAFNDEALVRAVAMADIPIISAIGHETDTTLIDYAADIRAPTPTAAAEFAVPVLLEQKAKMADLKVRISYALPKWIESTERKLEYFRSIIGRAQMKLSEGQARLASLAMRNTNALYKLSQQRSIRLASVKGLLQAYLGALVNKASIKLQRVESKNLSAYRAYLTNTHTKLVLAANLLQSLHYKKTLSRGFAIVKNASTELVSRAAAAQAEEVLYLEFFDAEVKVRPEQKSFKQKDIGAEVKKGCVKRKTQIQTDAPQLVLF